MWILNISTKCMYFINLTQTVLNCIKYSITHTDISQLLSNNWWPDNKTWVSSICLLCFININYCSFTVLLKAHLNFNWQYPVVYSLYVCRQKLIHKFEVTCKIVNMGRNSVIYFSISLVWSLKQIRILYKNIYIDILSTPNTNKDVYYLDPIW